eukprot:g11610.t1
MMRAVVLTLVLIGVAVGAAAPAPAASLEETREALQAAREAGDEAEERRFAERLATAFDDPYGAAYYGIMLVMGLGGETDVVRGAALIESGAVRGSLYGQVWLSGLYEEGLGVEPSDEKMLCWLRVAADRNFRPAIRRLWLLLRRLGAEATEERDALAETLYRIGDPAWLFSDAMVLLTNADPSDDARALAHLIIANRQTDPTLPEETPAMISAQLAHTRRQLDADGRGGAIVEAERIAAAWSAGELLLEPPRPDEAAACLGR